MTTLLITILDLISGPATLPSRQKCTVLKTGSGSGRGERSVTCGQQHAQEAPGLWPKYNRLWLQAGAGG